MKTIPTIDFVFDSDCPNVASARERLRQACKQLGIASSWSEWDRSDNATPDHLLHFGSPTILVNGNDIQGHSNAVVASCCRVYTASAGATSGVPPIDMILSALVGAVEVAAYHRR